MKKSTIAFLLLLLFFIACRTSTSKQVMPPGKYEFTYQAFSSAYETNDDEWKKLNKTSNGKITYDKGNEGTVTVSSIIKGSIQGRILTEVNTDTDQKMKNLPPNYSDFLMAGVYQETSLPPGNYYTVLYYSPERKELLAINHHGLKVVAVTRYANSENSINPFKNPIECFKMSPEEVQPDKVTSDTAISVSR